MAKQDRLFEDEIVHFKDETWYIESFPPDEELESPAPSQGLIASLRNARQQWVPNILYIDDNGRVRVVDGKRRIKAWRLLAELEQDNPEFEVPVIPVRIMDSAHDAELMAAQLNSLRSNNPFDTYRAVVRLQGQGLSAKGIKALLGLTDGQVNKYLRLAGMLPDLLLAWLDGNLATGVAETASKCTPQQQARLVEVLHENGEVTGDDVKRAKQITRPREIQQQFDDDWMPQLRPTGSFYADDGFVYLTTPEGQRFRLSEDQMNALLQEAEAWE